MWRKKAEEAVEQRKMEAKEKKSGRRRLRRGDGDLTDLFFGSSREGQCGTSTLIVFKNFCFNYVMYRLCNF